MSRHRLRPIALASAWFVMAGSGIADARASTTPSAAPAMDSVYCQIEADGQCHCGPRRGTGRNIPCRPDAAQQRQPPPAPARPAEQAGNSGPGCVYAVDPDRIQEILRARPGVCQRYGPDRIVCDAGNSQGASPSPTQSETWDQKLARELETEIEARASSMGLQPVPTRVVVTVSRTAVRWRPVSNDPATRPYYDLATTVVGEFTRSGRIQPADGRTRDITLNLGVMRPDMQSDPASASQAAACPYIPGQRLVGSAEQTTRPDSSAPVTGGVDDYGSPSPSSPPVVQVTYGRGWWRPAGQTKMFPLRIQVPVAQPLNVYSEGPIAPGPEGQYYNGFGGRLVRQWRPAQPGRAETFGTFRIEKLYTVQGTVENVNLSVQLRSIPPP